MQTPNPAARARARRAKPETRMRQQAQRLTSKALKALAEIMQGEHQAAVRLAAAREILDRAHGRPKLGEPEAGPEGLTVIVRQFTDPPDDEAPKAGDAA